MSMIDKNSVLVMSDDLKMMDRYLSFLMMGPIVLDKWTIQLD